MDKRMKSSPLKKGDKVFLHIDSPFDGADGKIVAVYGKLVCIRWAHKYDGDYDIMEMGDFVIQE